MSNPSYDVRVIRLIKSTREQSLNQFLCESEPTDAYVCLGHFDMIEIVKLDSENQSPLTAIQADAFPAQYPDTDNSNSDIEGNYVYPLYVLRQLNAAPDDEQARLEHFWALETNFLAVTRYHCDRFDRNDQRPFPEILLDRCKEVGPSEVDYATPSRCINLQVFPDGACEKVNVIATFYDSLELGDIVGVVKSNSLSAILAFQQNLYESMVVSEAYTYCGIDRMLFRNESDMPKILRKRGLSLRMFWLNHAATRFSVKHAQKAHELLKKLSVCKGRRSHYVTGTADIVLDWGRCTEQFLLEMMGQIARWDGLYDAFQGGVTRIGIKYREPVNSRKTSLQKRPFSETVPRLEDALVFLRTRRELDRWRYPVSKLLGTLRTMYENSVLDDLSDLLVPGVSAFLERVCYLLEHDMWDELVDAEMSSFLDCWNALTNDIAHLESQMVQHPELTAVRYYIPAMVLQFEQNVVRECLKIIQALDQKAAANLSAPQSRGRLFSPMLFPSSEENVSTQCFFDPLYDVAYSGNCPLCVSLPLHRLYEPWEVAHILVHELSHYCGDYLRRRKERLECLVESCAAYVVNFLRTHLSAPNRDSTIPAERKFQRDIAIRLRGLFAAKEYKSVYLNYVCSELPSAMFRLAADSEIQQTFQNITLHGLGPKEQLENIYAVCQEDAMEAGYTAFARFQGHILYCIRDLYKECYADILMILLLGCDFTDYYHCVYAKECERFPQEPQGDDQNNIFEIHTDRMAMVLIVMEQLQANWGGEVQFYLDSWGRSAWEKMIFWKRVKNDPYSPDYRWHRIYLGNQLTDFSLLADEAMQLEKYLISCGKGLQNLLNENQDLANMRDHLRNNIINARSDNFHWNEMRRWLESSCIDRETDS